MKVEISPMAINGREVPAVTSLQVAEAFGKEHKNILRDIKDVVSKCSKSFNALNFEPVEYEDAKGEKRPMYALSKDGFVMLVMGYTGEKAMALKEAYIARFNEMEAELSNRLLDVPNFSNPAVAARAWAEQYERRQIAEAQRDEAVRTKAWIREKREATCMRNTRTANEARDKAVRAMLVYENENEDLRNQIGDSKTYKTVKAQWARIRRLFDVKRGVPNFKNIVGKKVKAISYELDLPVHRVPEPTLGMVNAYHVDAWNKFFADCENDKAYLSSKCPRHTYRLPQV